MSGDTGGMIDWPAFGRARTELGNGFARILGYFREDGIKSVGAIEEAMRARNAPAMVMPAHTLKGEGSQFGADRLVALAEHIETVARRCVEHRQSPDELVSIVVSLRPLFNQTLALLESEAGPVIERRVSFGRKVAMTQDARIV